MGYNKKTHEMTSVILSKKTIQKINALRAKKKLRSKSATIASIIDKYFEEGGGFHADNMEDKKQLRA